MKLPPPLRLSFVILALAPVISGCQERASRRFEFEYRATVRDFPAGAEKARIWIPLPVSDEAQTVHGIEIDAPIAHSRTRERTYGNEFAYFEVERPKDPIELRVRIDVERLEISTLTAIGGNPPVARLIEGDRLAPLDGPAKARAESIGTGDFDALARGLYERVLSDVDYDKSLTGWGRGDLAWVCDAGKGNCSDFHTLFIAMARSRRIPALFEIGFPLPETSTEGEVGGYHCWAWYQEPGGAWRPVDISEADKRPEHAEYFFGTIDVHRVAFTRGRDIRLEPQNASGPVNFLVYPHVEVDGATDRATVERKFAFKNLDA